MSLKKIFLGNASKITCHIFRIFDSDGNGFLDFKEFLLALDIANRDTGFFPLTGAQKMIICVRSSVWLKLV